MRIESFHIPGQTRLASAAGQPHVVFASIDADAWTRAAETIREAGGRLVTLWGGEPVAGRFEMCAAYELDDGLLWLRLPVEPAADEAGDYPDLSTLFASATRMQRAVHDLVGLRARGAGDTRPWLDHGAWPRDYHPLRRNVTGRERFDSATVDYPFVPVAGDGVHEIAVGPIHAGVIEPGHFRFSVVGEKVLRLEERLGYAHRGVERLFERADALAGSRLAARIAGDSTVTFTWAYCMALEQAMKVRVPDRALRLRALLLERERVANHLGDLGALGNDAGFAVGLAQFSRLKEDWLRLNDRIFGHRYLMDRIVPGGVERDIAADDAAALVAQCDRIEAEVRAMQTIYDDQSGLQDRFAGTGRLTAQTAAHFGVCGLAARASGKARDARVDHRLAPYDAVPVDVVSDERGDVAARVAVRFAETYESMRAIRALLADLPGDGIAAPVASVASVANAPSGSGDAGAAGRGADDARRGVGWIEGWRGPVLVALELGAHGGVARCHCHDPSWHNWPALEHAIIGNIVPDFPLINKSFNLNYAGHDL
ncbi:NADH-quinone oxidoreductase subunit C [Burkholderia oklahomensis]|uniref:Respiratory-chain NADH dehydrogenase, 30 Kd subunit n=1 Tax=Burkholderia oklahomensis TaxID=342113 RepID=A0AAI8BE83_9BURK|nr:NADH-quinone oxidoreductase subunit C [Burkholderia oklahomensis]AIO70652.1 respiratory-chain NADH dehydrogenase, 30 Kd subunit [Burkholderia oklahomensis]AOI39266.1 formate hydrogenlyase [Burkholderia oklahomensis EO147]KUY51756.1 formate hydrogenlyase [Burkholderia oklahomensis EO147]QPS40383.1 NADH-quinone oxidoreductase subunit C [Burkholderia oklahomensis]